MKSLTMTLTALCALLMGNAFANQKAMCETYKCVDVQTVINQKANSDKITFARRHHLGYRGFPGKREATGNKVFVFSPALSQWAAYDKNGNLVRTGRASGGKLWCADVGRSCRTPQGKFRVYKKGNAACKSSKYPLGTGGAAMPYCMHFNGGYAIHGSPHVPNYPASHGCIRVTPQDAHWLHQNFINVGTSVEVTGYRM